MFRKASLTRNTMVVSTPNDIGDAPLLLSAARVYSDCDKPFGAAFLNIFKVENRPHSDKNVALLYTVGALGRNKKAEGEGVVDDARAKYVKSGVQDFLKEIYQTGRNVVQLVLEYNASRDETDSSLPAVEVIRLPIVSGGVFIHPDTTPKEVALALLWGVSAALLDTSPSSRPEVELMPGRDMQEAYDLYRSGAAPSQWNTLEGKYMFATVSEAMDSASPSSGRDAPSPRRTSSPSSSRPSSPGRARCCACARKMAEPLYVPVSPPCTTPADGRSPSPSPPSSRPTSARQARQSLPGAYSSGLSSAHGWPRGGAEGWRLKAAER